MSETTDLAAQAKLWCTRTGAARLVNLSEGAIRKAVARGDLATYPAADGTQLIHVPDLLAWRARKDTPS